MRRYILQAEARNGTTFTLFGIHYFKRSAMYRAWSVNRRYPHSSILSEYKVVRVK